MQSLAAGRDLESIEQQVESGCGAFSSGPAAWMRIEGPRRQRKADHEDCGHAVFLVELGALREIGDTVEILDLEEVRAALRTPSHDLRRHNLGEMLRGQVLAKITEDRRLDSEDVADAFVSQREGSVLRADLR